jgi:F-type H+-transporting ATPase subunit a
VTGDVQVAAAPANVAGGCHIFSGCGYPAPGLQDFNFKPLFTIGSFGFTKPMLIAILCTIGVIALFWAAFSRPKLVPRGVQNIGEIAILAVRDQILRPSLGRKGDSYLPFLVSLFFFIFVNNLMELIPFFQFPTMSRIGFVWPLVAIVYILYLYLGFKNQGVWGYFRNMIPPGVPFFILPILIPVEIARFFIVQPFTLGVRLFANMFAGHLLLTIFYLATWYLLSLSFALLFAVGSAGMVVFVFLLELLVDLLQAFIFTTLTATYIASSLEAEH